MFWKTIAILFLILFLIKLINPKVFPFFKKAVDTIFHFVGYTFSLFFQSSLYTFHLVFNRTIYVIGLDILIAFILNVIITTIAYPNILDFSTWFSVFKQSLIDVYVFSFFVFTYVIGLLTYIKNKEQSFKNIFSFAKFESKIFKNVNDKIKNKGTFEYDEKKNEYKYYD